MKRINRSSFYFSWIKYLTQSSNSSVRQQKVGLFNCGTLSSPSRLKNTEDSNSQISQFIFRCAISGTLSLAAAYGLGTQYSLASVDSSNYGGRDWQKTFSKENINNYKRSQYRPQLPLLLSQASNGGSCTAIPGAITPQPDAINWTDGNFKIFTVGNNTNTLGFQESGFQQEAYSRGRSLVSLNGSSDYSFTGASGSGSATSSVGTFNNGTLSFSTSYTTTNRAEFRTTTADSFISGSSGHGVFIFPEQGGTTNDFYTVSIDFTTPVTAFSFDLVDIFDTLTDNNPILSYEVYADGQLIAYFNGPLLGDDGVGAVNIYDGSNTLRGSHIVGQNIESAIGFITDTPVSNVSIRHIINSGSILASARDPHGIDHFNYSTDLPCDYSDAPADGNTAPDGSSGTTGYGEATHLVVSDIKLGANIDAETSAQSNAAANGDDNDSDGDDDDGINIPSLIAGQTVTVTADVSGAGGYLQGWIDWDGNGSFDAGEQVATDIQDNGTKDNSNTTGTISFDVSVPSGAITTSNTFARFRWSTTQGLDTTTAASDGEVEDYQIAIAARTPVVPTATCPASIYNLVEVKADSRIDEPGSSPEFEVGHISRFSDVAVMNGTTLDLLVEVVALTNQVSGANNSLRQPGGLSVQPEGSIKSDMYALDESNSTPESSEPIGTRRSYELKYTFVEKGTTNPINTNFEVEIGDIDNYQTGNKEARSEFMQFPNTAIDDFFLASNTQLLATSINNGTGVEISNGTRTSFNPGANPRRTVKLQLQDVSSFNIVYGAEKISANQGVGSTGFDFLALDPMLLGGCDRYDYGDAPDTGSGTASGNYETLRDNGGPSHKIVDGLYLGSQTPDADNDGTPTSNADGDDNSVSNINFDDEDGVQLGSNDLQGETLYRGDNVTLNVATQGAGVLNAWIDWNADGDFDDTVDGISEKIAVDVAPSNDTISLPVTVPENASIGDTYARFRYSSDTGLNPTGIASDGEVEDYKIAIAIPYQTINTTSSCQALGGTLSGNNLFTPLDNGTFGFENGQPNQSPTIDPYPGIVSGGNFDYFYDVGHGDYGYVAYDVQRRNTFQHDNITDPVYGATGRFFASDPDSDTPKLTTTLSGLTPNQFYEYSFWAANSEPNPPSSNDVSAIVNGTEIYNTGDLPTFPQTLEWKKHTVSFTNGASSSITIDLESNKTGPGGNDFYLDNIELRSCNFIVDYGDAPPSYGDAFQTTIPSSPNIYLGLEAPDGENATPLGGDNGVDADGDDDTSSGTDDEDAFAFLGNVPLTGTYELNDIPVNNTSGADVTLHAWIDFDRDGKFSASEYQDVTVADGDTTADLSWTVPNGTTSGDTYARFRITPDVLLIDNPNTADVDERSQNAAVNGEVEDYPIAIAPAPLCPAAKADIWFANDESGSIDANEFEDALDFIYQISDGFVYDYGAGMRAGITGWTEVPNQRTIIPITESFGDPGDFGLFANSNISLNGNNQGVREQYQSRPGTSHGTRLDLAANYLASLISGSSGDRSNTAQVAVILTDANASEINAGGLLPSLNAAQALQSTGANVVMVLIEQAISAYENDAISQVIIDSIVADDGIIIKVPTYAAGANPTNDYIRDTSQAICDLSNPTASDPGLILVKRITAIYPSQPDEPDIQFNDFVDQPNFDADNHPLWPDSDEDPNSNTNLYLRGVLNGGDVKPGDEIEYTVYFLSQGDEAAQQVHICDVVPDHLTYVTDAYGSDRGIALGYDPSVVTTAPNQYLTNFLYDDEGDFYEPGTAPPANLCKKIDDNDNLVTVDEHNNDNGAIILRPATSLPPAASPGQPAGSYGFIRFRGKVK